MEHTATLEVEPIFGNTGVFPDMAPDFVAGEVAAMEEQFATPIEAGFTPIEVMP